MFLLIVWDVFSSFQATWSRFISFPNRDLGLNPHREKTHGKRPFKWSTGQIISSQLHSAALTKRCFAPPSQHPPATGPFQEPPLNSISLTSALQACANSCWHFRFQGQGNLNIPDEFNGCPEMQVCSKYPMRCYFFFSFWHSVKSKKKINRL